MKMAQLLQRRGIQISTSTVRRRLLAFRTQSSTIGQNSMFAKSLVTSRVRRYLPRLIRCHKQLSTVRIHKSVLQMGFPCSYSTVARALKADPGLLFSHPRPRQYMTRAHKAQRLLWAQETINADIDWRNVFFADEKVWLVEGPSRRTRVWSIKQDGPPILPRRGDRKKALHVWGCFSAGHAPDLVMVDGPFNSAQYCHILATALPAQGSVLYHDRHPVHSSRETKGWIEARNLDARLLPPRGADLNPIENLWGILSRRVFDGMNSYSSVDALHAAVNAAWASVQRDTALRANLVDSMARRLTAVVDRNGGPADV